MNQIGQQHMIDRRNFIGSSNLCTAGVLINSGFAGIDDQLTSKPVANNLSSPFKLSLAAYSYRQLLSGSQPKMDLEEFIDDCAKFGLQGTELTSYYFPQNPTPAFLYNLKAHAFRNGLDVSGTAIRNDFGQVDPEKLAVEISHVKRWVDYAEMMGTSVIRIFAGHHQKNNDVNSSYQQMIASMEECCDYAGQHGVFLALENHGGPTATADGLLQFVKDIRSPWFGLNLDTGNFHSKDIYGDIERVAPHALNVQVKVAVSGPDKQKKEADFDRLKKILTRCKYRGYVVLEFEEKGDPRLECPKYLDQLRGAFQG